MNDNLKEKGLLPLEELIKTLEEKGIDYDRKQIEDAYFPLKDVEACLNEGGKPIIARKGKDYPNHRPCPLCGKPSEELKWIWFDSPKLTWENLMGRAGDMSICSECRCIVEFICVLLN